MGDLNTTKPRAGGYRSLAVGATFPAPAPTEQLDHILARGPVGTLRSSATRLLPLSDHRALICDIG